VTGIDADLGPGPPPAPVVNPPVVVPPPTASKPKPKRCKKGYRKKRVHGKVRCVKKKRVRHHRHGHGRPAVRGRATFRLGR
jgi:hypothetical protein